MHFFYGLQRIIKIESGVTFGIATGFIKLESGDSEATIAVATVGLGATLTLMDKLSEKIFYFRKMKLI